MKSDIWARSQGKPTLGHINLVDFFFFPWEFCFNRLLIPLFLPGFFVYILIHSLLQSGMSQALCSHIWFLSLLLFASQPNMFFKSNVTFSIRILLIWSFLVLFFEALNELNYTDTISMHHEVFLKCSYYSFITAITIDITVLLTSNTV